MRTGAVTADGQAHSIFHSSDPNHRFRAGGLINLQGEVDHEALHRLLQLLALRIEEASRTPEAKLENKNLPAGTPIFCSSSPMTWLTAWFPLVAKPAPCGRGRAMLGARR